MVIILLKFPKYALDCISVLSKNGFEAYFVGGCVRDGLLGRPCYDIDITTSALPEETMRLFPSSVPTGISHGTVTVIQDGSPIEITTYRKEEGYLDKRHPDKVSFVSSLKEDLSRRDFTINALACNKDGEITDLFGGLGDLENRIIRTVGKPEERFSEDALRILRTYRFASTLDFDIEESTALSAIKLANNITDISGERILKELIKAANGTRPSAVLELINTNALKEFGIESTQESSAIDGIPSLNLNEIYSAALFIFMLKHDTMKVKTSLKASNQLLSCLTTLEQLSSCPVPNNKIELKTILFKFGTDLTYLYLQYLKLNKFSSAESLLNTYEEILNNDEIFSINRLAVTGNDLKELGFSGREIGNKLYEALLFVIENNEMNTKEEILKHLKN